MNQVIEKAGKYFLKTYNRYPLVIDRGQGVYLYDDQGKKYLDFGSGIGVFALGYGDERYKNALKDQIDKIMHTSNYFYNKQSVDAAEKFVQVSKMDRVFFTNSGTEAVEGAIKIARKYYYKKTGTEGGQIIAMRNSFHGRTMGALAVTGQPALQKGFGTMLSDVKFADFNDLDSVKAQINENTCGILLETLQGEGGLYTASDEFIKGVRKLCDDNDILLITDEVQCGMGRTGYMFTYQKYDILPDVMATAKAVGCGIPVGVFAARGKAADVLEPGDHGSTYGYNPLACAAVNAVLDIYKQDNIVSHVKEISAYLNKKLQETASKYSCIKEIRGMGLMVGIEFDRPVNKYILKGQELGLIMLSAGKNIIRLLPPLVIKKEHVDEMVEILNKCIETDCE